MLSRVWSYGDGEGIRQCFALEVSFLASLHLLQRRGGRTMPAHLLHAHRQCACLCLNSASGEWDKRSELHARTIRLLLLTAASPPLTHLPPNILHTSEQHPKRTMDKLDVSLDDLIKEDTSSRPAHKKQGGGSRGSRGGRGSGGSGRNNGGGAGPMRTQQKFSGVRYNPMSRGAPPAPSQQSPLMRQPQQPKQDLVMTMRGT